MVYSIIQKPQLEKVKRNVENPTSFREPELRGAGMIEKGGEVEITKLIDILKEPIPTKLKIERAIKDEFLARASFKTS